MEGFLNLAWLLPIPPFLAFVAILLFLNRNKTVSALTAIGSVLVSFVLGWPIAFAVFTTPHFGEHPLYGELFSIPTGTSSLMIGYQVDPANALMIFMVTFLLVMIFVYSSGYMTFPAHLKQEDYPQAYAQNKDPRYSRFMAYISLFATGMLGLVVANSLLTFFVFWEIMGLCSYLLIGFWFEKESAKKAAFKAFITTRIGDAIMFAGMMLLWMWSIDNTLVFEQILAPANLEHLAEMMVHVPVFNFTTPAIGLIAVLIFFGTIRKSAQFPLHVWLPDAMEGPTPVSAIIHAAAMVSAGIFMLLRIFPIIAVSIDAAPYAGLIIAGIGAFTALMAATIALAQYDVKGVLAYSTISQLGFMVAAVGLGAYVPAAFHLITHAFFKALLFLASGSVIHGMEHGAIHAHDHHLDPQDMRNMGGLRHKMPVTFWTFVIGGLALAGFPFVTAGFWSKDEIFAEAWYQWSHDAKILALVVFITLATAALLTAFYTMRQISMTFLGKPRTALAEHASESTPFMTIPLVLLSIFAVAAGWSGISDRFLGTNGIFSNFFHHYAGAEYFALMEELHELGLVQHTFETLPWSWVPLIVSLVVALGGLALGWWVYARRPLEAGQTDPMVNTLGPAHRFLNNKWGWDGLYNQLFIAPTIWFSEKIAYELIDKGIIDTILHGIARAFYAAGATFKRFEEVVISGGVDKIKDGFLAVAKELRYLQTGKVQEYALISVFLATVLALVVLLSDWFRGILGGIF